MYDVFAELDKGIQIQQPTRYGARNTGRRPDDEGLLVRFYMDKKQNHTRSKEMGCPQFDDVEFIEITVPGHTRTTVVHEVRDEHRQRFPLDYDMFKRNEKKAVNGFPLEEWPPMTKSMCETMKFFSIRTVEQLAAVPDAVLDQMGAGARAYQEKARTFLETAKAGAPAQKLAEDMEVLRDENASLKAQIAELAGRLEKDRSKK